MSTSSLLTRLRERLHGYGWTRSRGMHQEYGIVAGINSGSRSPRLPVSAGTLRTEAVSECSCSRETHTLPLCSSSPAQVRDENELNARGISAAAPSNTLRASVAGKRRASVQPHVVREERGELVSADSALSAELKLCSWRSTLTEGGSESLGGNQDEPAVDRTLVCCRPIANATRFPFSINPAPSTTTSKASIVGLKSRGMGKMFFSRTVGKLDKSLLKENLLGRSGDTHLASCGREKCSISDNEHEKLISPPLDSFTNGPNYVQTQHPHSVYYGTGRHYSVTSADNVSINSSCSSLDEDSLESTASDSTSLLGIPRAIGRDAVRRSMSTTTFFKDKKRAIDFVLAFQPGSVSSSKATFHGQYRLQFERRLKQQGLKLEYESVELSQDGRTCFVKIHAPWDVLARTAEINRVKMPIRESDIPKKESGSMEDWLNTHLLHNPFDVDPSLRLSETEYFTAAFSRERVHQFLIEDKSTFFTSAQRIRMVWDLILRTTIDVPGYAHDKHGDAVGIKWLLKEGIYVAAYPLHDGDYSEASTTDQEDMNKDPEDWPLRRWLYETWARPRNWYRYQPLNQIGKYYGEKVAMYFAWMGFYTRMLVFPAIVGTLCFFYGVSMSGLSAIPRHDVCHNSAVANETVCRLCNKNVCPFKTLQASCLYATLTYVFDNSATVFFAFFVSIWAVVFLELWKRRQAELSWDWDVRDLEMVEDNIRPEYQVSVKTKRTNPVTQEEEPYMPAKNKLQRLMTSFATVLFMLFVVLGILVGIIFYRIVGIGLYHQVKDPLVQKISAPIITSITAAAINAVCILVLGKMYERLAWLLTSNEFPRTETDFENSYTYKVFIFEFINYYAALFYIAFFKGKVFGPPNSKGYVDRCDPVGCLIDVCIQLAVIMIVKQLMTNVVEIGWPIVANWWKRRKNVAETEENKYTRWEKDFDLSPLPELGLFDEYLEMIIQYGFVTMFVAAFPLAPLFALLNNVAEIRLDAYKLTTQFRRPVPLRAQDIGAWYRVLEIITKIAVVTNGLVIAFTSDFIDRLVYVTVYSKDGTLNGYILHVFSVFNTSSWTDVSLRSDPYYGNVTTCLYRDYRKSPNDVTADGMYERTRTWWHVLVARLFFVLAFEHCVFLIQGVIQYLIPDIPEHVHVRIQRENYLAKQALYLHEFPTVGDGSNPGGTPLATTKNEHPVNMDAMMNAPPPQKPSLANGMISRNTEHWQRRRPVKFQRLETAPQLMDLCHSSMKDNSLCMTEIREARSLEYLGSSAQSAFPGMIFTQTTPEAVL